MLSGFATLDNRRAKLHCCTLKIDIREKKVANRLKRIKEQVIREKRDKKQVTEGKKIKKRQSQF